MTLIVKRGIWHDAFLDVPSKVAAEMVANDPAVVYAQAQQQPQGQPQQAAPAKAPKMTFDQLAPYAQRAITMQPRGVAPNPNMDLDMDTERNNEQANQMKSLTNNIKSKQKLQQAQSALSTAQNPQPLMGNPQAPELAPEQQVGAPQQAGAKMAADTFVCNTDERTPKGQFAKGRRVGKSAIERMRELMGGENGRPFPQKKQQI